MTIDGFHASDARAFRGYDARFAELFYRAVDRLAAGLRVEVVGLENIPSGRALLVGNHAFGWDAIFPIAAMSRQLGRQVWVLGEHAWWRVPFLRKLASRVGVVDGTQENLAALLAREQLVMVLPGGLREAVKPRELRYQLLWGKRYGFVRAALRSGAPLVPVASIGTDELFDFVGNAYARGRRWFHSALPIPLPARLLPIPHRVRVHFRVGEAIPCAGGAGAAEDFHAVRRLRREVEGELHELIEQELAARCGIALD